MIPNAKGIIPQTDGGAEEGRPAGDHPQAGRGLHVHDDRPRHDQVPGGALRTRTRCCTSSDFRQALALQDALRPGPALGLRPASSWQHICFGSVLGEDRKPLETRKGGRDRTAARCSTRRSNSACRSTRRATASARAIGHDVPELTDEEKRDIAEAVGIGAVKYADLSQNRTSDYVFNYDKMLATDGQHGDVHAVRLRPLPQHLPQGRGRRGTRSARTRRRCSSRTRRSGRWRCNCCASRRRSRPPRPTTCRTSSPRTCGTWRRASAASSRTARC